MRVHTELGFFDEEVAWRREEVTMVALSSRALRAR